MLDNPVFWLGLIALSPAFFVFGKVLTGLLFGLFVGDKLTVTVRKQDGRTKKVTVHLGKKDELSQLLDEVVVAAKSGRSARR